MIVAISKVQGATAVYTDDEDVAAYAREAGMDGFMLADLPKRPEEAQHSLPLERDRSNHEDG